MLVFQSQIFSSANYQVEVYLRQAKIVLLFLSVLAASRAVRGSPGSNSIEITRYAPAFFLRMACRCMRIRVCMHSPQRGGKRCTLVCGAQSVHEVHTPCDGGCLFVSLKGRTGQDEDSLHLPPSSFQMHYRHDSGRMLMDSCFSRCSGCETAVERQGWPFRTKCFGRVASRRTAPVGLKDRSTFPEPALSRENQPHHD